MSQLHEQIFGFVENPSLWTMQRVGADEIRPLVSDRLRLPLRIFKNPLIFRAGFACPYETFVGSDEIRSFFGQVSPAPTNFQKGFP